MLNMFHLISNTAARRQSQQMCSRKQNGGSVLYFIVAQESTITLRCRLRMNKTRRKC